MKARDIREHFLSRAPWVNRERTLDKIVMGDPEEDFYRCLVTWTPSMKALRQVVERGYRLLITHEPTFFYINHDVPPREDDGFGWEKATFIREHGITIIRNHDAWDRWPEIGIPWSWGGFLVLGEKPAAVGGNDYLHRYDIEPLRFGDFAARVAARCATIGEPQVQVVGDPDQLVSRIGTGTGCGCEIDTYLAMGCDCSIVSDDGSCYWSGIQGAEDIGHPVIRVNHGTSEEAGMVTLTQYINDHVDGLTAEHLPHGCTFRLAAEKERIDE
jgi:putative NIF3 family GTP cyclohydrolase 1 type 2